MLFALLRKQGVQDFEANDVVQDVFVKLLAKVHTYERENCKFRSWLFSVAHHTLIDRARRRASHRKALDGWAAQMLQATPSDSVKMAEEWVRIHRTKILRYALESVRRQTSARGWSCFEQRLLRDRPRAEIAAELGLEPNAVFVNSCRVLKTIRAVCQEFDEDLSDVIDSSVSRRD
jgi:RNA polymerase sigma-70 factor (ECF subfamily)